MIRGLAVRFLEWVTRPLEMFDVDPTSFEEEDKS